MVVVGVKRIASVSFGKDSLAMLLRLLEEDWPLDEVVFYDTGMEFRAIYDIRDRLVPLLKEKGVRYTELHPGYDFEWKMFDKPVNGPNGPHNGYSWCGGRCRWGTRDKLSVIERYCKGAIEYVGIAADEVSRLEKERKGCREGKGFLVYRQNGCEILMCDPNVAHVMRKIYCFYQYRQILHTKCHIISRKET